MSNYLIAGPSGSGKTTVGKELERRGFRVVHTDRSWGYWGDRLSGTTVDFPEPGTLTREWYEINGWLWHSDRVERSIATSGQATFYCGGADNQALFYPLFDKIFLLDTDWHTVKRRLQARKNHHTSEAVLIGAISRSHHERNRETAPSFAVKLSTHEMNPQETVDVITSFIDETRLDAIRRHTIAFLSRL